MPGTAVPASRAGRAGSGPRRPVSIPCRATFISNGLITPPWGVPSSVGANRPRSITPAFSHLRDQSPRGERARATRAGDHDRFGRMPPPGPRPAPTAAGRCVPSHGHEDRLDRVVAATARPESVRPRLEPGLPLGFQRAERQRLKAPVRDHGNSERALLSVGLRYDTPA